MKLMTIKKEIKTKDVKNSHACGKTDITGLAIFEAQPSNVKTCNIVNIACESVENSTKTPPYK